MTEQFLIQRVRRRRLTSNGWQLACPSDDHHTAVFHPGRPLAITTAGALMTDELSGWRRRHGPQQRRGSCRGGPTNLDFSKLNQRIGQAMLHLLDLLEYALGYFDQTGIKVQPSLLDNLSLRLFERPGLLVWSR